MFVLFNKFTLSTKIKLNIAAEADRFKRDFRGVPLVHKYIQNLQKFVLKTGHLNKISYVQLLQTGWLDYCYDRYILDTFENVTQILFDERYVRATVIPNKYSVVVETCFYDPRFRSEQKFLSCVVFLKTYKQTQKTNKYRDTYLP